MSHARLAGLAAAVVLAAFAVLGGEYSTLDWLHLRRELTAERRAVRDLKAAIDSLAKLARDLETNPAAQERAAREQFGMIRAGEQLYRLVPRVETGSGSTPARPHP